MVMISMRSRRDSGGSLRAHLEQHFLPCGHGCRDAVGRQEMMVREAKGFKRRRARLSEAGVDDLFSAVDAQGV